MNNFDKTIEEVIKDTLKREMQESAHDINIQSRAGYVTLSGFVDVLNEKNTAGELAARVEGVKSIENCLTISTDGSFSDKECETEVMNKLNGIEGIEGISSKVQRGLAVLEGRVKTLKHKNLAIHQTAKAMGVKDIVSHIEVKSLGKFDDATIHNSLQQELINDDFDDCDIRTDVENGSVRISGYVNTLHDMESALEIAEGVEGVRNVKNFMRIRDN